MLLYSYLIAFGHFPEFEVFHHLFNVVSSALEERPQSCLNNLRSGFHHSSDQHKTQNDNRSCVSFVLKE